MHRQVLSRLGEEASDSQQIAWRTSDQAQRLLSVAETWQLALFADGTSTSRSETASGSNTVCENPLQNFSTNPPHTEVPSLSAACRPVMVTRKHLSKRRLDSSAREADRQRVGQETKLSTADGLPARTHHTVPKANGSAADMTRVQLVPQRCQFSSQSNRLISGVTWVSRREEKTIELQRRRCRTANNFSYDRDCRNVIDKSLNGAGHHRAQLQLEHFQSTECPKPRT